MTVPPLGSPSIPRHDSADETSSSSNSVVVETAAQVETLTILPAVQPERSGSDLTGVAAEIGGMPPPKARLKVPLEKGYSQMVWLRLLQTEPDLAGLKGKSNRRLISLEEVKQHRTDDDAWTILRGRVYNISPYIRFHPGGRDMLMKGAGRDCTSLFNKYHAWVNAEYLLEKCLVTKLLVALAEGFCRILLMVRHAVSGEWTPKLDEIPEKS